MKVLPVLFAVVSLFFSACSEEEFIPKPRGYYRIELPEKRYQAFQKEGYPYRFEYPVYTHIEKDSLFFDQAAENPWWINIVSDTLNAKIYLSYKAIDARQTLAQLIEDSYKMSHYHTKRADYINEDMVFHTPNQVHGLFYEVGGNAASAFQFFATDSHKHFIRGALYFNATPNKDSLEPLNRFMRKDIEHMIQTLQWTR